MQGEVKSQMGVIGSWCWRLAQPKISHCYLMSSSIDAYINPVPIAFPMFHLIFQFGVIFLNPTIYPIP